MFSRIHSLDRVSTVDIADIADNRRWYETSQL